MAPIWFLILPAFALCTVLLLLHRLPTLKKWWIGGGGFVVIATAWGLWWWLHPSHLLLVPDPYVEYNLVHSYCHTDDGDYILWEGKLTARGMNTPLYAAAYYDAETQFLSVALTELCPVGEPVYRLAHAHGVYNLRLRIPDGLNNIRQTAMVPVKCGFREAERVLGKRVNVSFSSSFSPESGSNQE